VQAWGRGLRKDLIASPVLLAIAAVYYLAATDIPVTSLEDEIGPRGLPTILAALLALIAVALGLRALLIPAVAAPADAHEQDSEEAPPARAFGLIAVGALYIPLAFVLGYVPAVFLLLLGVMFYEGLKPSIRSFAVAAGGALFFWLLFVAVLGVDQPEGLFFR
jgi:hypothetical protein